MRLLSLSLIVLLFMSAVALAQEDSSTCDADLAFWKRHSAVVALERDRYLQRFLQADMERAYLKQQVEQITKVKAEKPQP